jgi:hypothetical protein
MAPKKQPDRRLWTSLHWRLDGPELVQLESGDWFPKRLMAAGHYDDGPSVALYFLVEEGRAVLYEVNFGGPPPSNPRLARRPLVTPSLVHGLPLGHIIDWTIDEIVKITARERAGTFLTVPEVLALRERTASLRGRPVSDETLQQVAVIVKNHDDFDYRLEVAKQLHVSDRTASRWISLARGRGFLPEEGEKA